MGGFVFITQNQNVEYRDLVINFLLDCEFDDWMMSVDVGNEAVNLIGFTDHEGVINIRQQNLSGLGRRPERFRSAINRLAVIG